MMEFVWPWLFALIPLPFLIRARWSVFDLPVSALTVPLLSRFRGEVDTAPAPVGRPRGSVTVLWIAWIALLAAGARPQWIGEPVQLPVTGRDVMLAVDLSGSMGTEDLTLDDQVTNRLAVVKRVLVDFIARRTGDRLGLVLFGTNAYVQAPLTHDLTTVTRLLNEAPIGIAGGRTAIGDAIGLSVKLLRDRPAEQRVLILLTDGASNAGAVDPRNAAELAQRSDVRIYTIGVGAATLRMPGLFGMLGGVVNPSADMDEPTLTAIAERTGGQYFRAQDTEALVGVYEAIDALEPIDQDPELYRPTAALFHWPLAVAWLCILGLLILRRGNRA
ncbi:MAG: VWA domain-containing protein [Pseudomonadales bacterium]